jgi:diguanylate cyclase (GGDEF)-like protein
MRHSLKHKVVLLIVIIALFLSVGSIVVSVRTVSNIIQSNYEKEATNLSRTAASLIDAEALDRLRVATEKIYNSLDPKERVSSEDWGSDAFNEYVSNFEDLAKTEDYKTIHHQLRLIQDANDVNCVYTCFLDNKNRKFIYLVDAAKDDPCPIGCFDPLLKENYRLLEDPTIGFPTYTSNMGEYGYLATSGTAVFDKAGEVVGYAMVDISMDDIFTVRNRMLSILIGLQILISAIIIILAVILVNRVLVRPVNLLSQAAMDYCKDQDVSNHCHFSELNIRTRDEIEDLSDSMKQMEEDLNDKITNLLETTDELIASKQEIDKMHEIALKDALTGVLNKHAYNAAIQMLEDSARRFGLVVIDLNGLKGINDTYGHEKGDLAIKHICGIICSVFGEDSVYRIGGDEFVVMLNSEELKDIETLVARFDSALLANAEDSDLVPWECVSAAVGYAIYDQDRDGTPDGTFRQADRAMYMRKQEMKRGLQK